MNRPVFFCVLAFLVLGVVACNEDTLVETGGDSDQIAGGDAVRGGDFAGGDIAGGDTSVVAGDTDVAAGDSSVQSGDTTGGDLTGGDAAISSGDTALPPEAWYGIGGSELAPHSTRITTVGVGGISNSTDPATSTDAPAVAIGSDRNPVVAWHVLNAAGADIYVRRFDGSSWVELDGSASGAGISSSSAYAAVPAIAIDSQDRVVVAWQDNGSGARQIYVKRFDGSIWEELASSATGGGVSQTAESSSQPSLAIGTGDAVVLAWEQDTAASSEILVRVYDGAGWSGLAGSDGGTGLSATPAESSSAPKVAAFSGRYAVSWSELNPNNSFRRLYVYEWNGVSWAERAGPNAGPIAVPSFSPVHHDLAWDSTGRIIVALSATENGVVDSNEIFVRAFDGVSWTGVVGAVTSGGFYLNGTNIWPIALRVDDSDAMHIAWSDNTTGVDEIHYVRRVGTEWQALSGSDQGAGVSNSAVTSHDVGIGVSADRVCLVWNETDFVGSQIVSRCHDF